MPRDTRAELWHSCAMTNQIALWIGAAVLLALGLDALLNGAAGTVFALKKLVDLMEWIAFWR